VQAPQGGWDGVEPGHFRGHKGEDYRTYSAERSEAFGRPRAPGAAGPARDLRERGVLKSAAPERLEVAVKGRTTADWGAWRLQALKKGAMADCGG
jgi:hypothetical protein